ncbi:MAG TPA: DUF4129 domain-containing protein [Gemmatimonadales bacterium]|nr:DUF4129 domain-containing protein [Gemmatimonadales bacterium]
MRLQEPGDRFRETLDTVFAGPAYRWAETPGPIRVLREWWERLGDWLRALRADNPLVYRFLVIGLLVALLLVLAHAGWAVWRTARYAARDDGGVRDRAAGEARDAAWYARAADAAAAGGRLVEALQLAFLAVAMTLHDQGAVQYHASKTPAEYAREARLSAGDRERLRALVRALYAHVFGARPIDLEEYRRWRAAGAPPWHAPAG